MTDVIWIESETSVGPEIGYRTVTPDAAVEWLDRLGEGGVVVVGETVPQPLELARRVRSRRQKLRVVVVCEPDELEEFRETTRLDLLLAGAVRIVSTGEDVRQAVDEVVEEDAAHGRYREAMEYSQVQLDSAPSASRRPSPEQYKSLMWSSAPVGALAVIRGSHHVVAANPAATRLFEQDEIDLIGEPLHEVMASDETGWEWISSDRTDHHVEHIVTRRTEEGEEAHLALRSVEAESAGEDVVLVLVWDVTERVKYERLQSRLLAAEREAREAAERASEAREEVLGTVSHDLRSPLQSILMSSEVLKKISGEAESEKVEELADDIGQSAMYMERLVGDLLDLARIEGQGLSIEVETAQVEDLVEEAVGLAEPTGGEGEGRIAVEGVDPSLTLECDRDRVVQLLQNLLSNALKFSDESDPVEVAAFAHDGDVRFEVTDYGPGIPPEEIPHLFDRFWQSEGGGGDRGAGLGLAIVKGIVDAHHGDIHVDSEPGEGTTLCVDLPKRQG